ncbi:FUSC family protein [Flavobacterium agricola]|uniref:FUSC family protein n=1 Tax=Flavobacterium agricola TaxID=2870839 RepID=A0ABY6M3E5_9FLAO|nr:FUSC family protein [Flavobacterium agricola]UYW01903.1 FUSC family protein [Flavobacterium agricola]
MKKYIAFDKTTRKWHLPVVAGLAVGIPMIFGWYIDNFDAGKLASLAGLSILYIQSDKLSERMMLLMTCCFGIMSSYAIGLLFSFNPFFAPLALGFLSFFIHYSLHKLHLTRPPGNFFFIMLASTAICTPFDMDSIPTKIGYIALGTIFTCSLGFVYSLLTLKKQGESSAIRVKDSYTNIVESIIFGVFILISLAIAFGLELDNPYWMPISCLAVMQGSNSKHTWKRGTQRIIGTFIGLGITWLIAYNNPSPLFMVISITLLQMIVEFLVVRNYGIAVIFITVLTIFLSESGGQLSQDTDQVFLARLFDISIGSIIGIIGGWALYHEKIHYYATQQLQKFKNEEDL